MLNRRLFMHATAAAAATLVLPRTASAAEPLFQVSLAQWSHNKAFFGRGGVEKKDPFKFAAIAAKDYGIFGVEYVNQFYKDKKGDDKYLADLKKIADDHKVTSVLIMCDGEGNLGDPDAAKRGKAVDNHKRWVEWAKFLGCHSIRVNAASSGSYEEQVQLAADGLHKLCEFADTHAINVIVENHGGLSSNGQWLAKVMKECGHKRVGTLPDFGNFTVRRADPKKPGDKAEVYDRYKGVDELMPFAKGVSAKTHDFDGKGECIETDYHKMMDIVCKKHKYRGWVGIEYEGGKISEAEGIKATQKLLAKCLAELG
jgi:L-ribulose-5-phosphate 3-epimerase